MHTLDVRLRDADGIGPESNAWLAEFAGNGKNILIVDDINDTGATFEWIKNDWHSSVYNLEDGIGETVLDLLVL